MRDCTVVELNMSNIRSITASHTPKPTHRTTDIHNKCTEHNHNTLSVARASTTGHQTRTRLCVRAHFQAHRLKGMDATAPRTRSASPGGKWTPGTISANAGMKMLPSFALVPKMQGTLLYFPEQSEQ